MRSRMGELVSNCGHFRGLTFDMLTAVNRARATRWHPGFPEDNTWTGGDWSNAMQGEAGEAGNIVKKLRRLECGFTGVLDGSWPELIERLGEELADTMIYLDLVATKYGVDLPVAIVRKFNAVSELQGFPERLES
jgi:NTP pyrophosphatase (non-canonical NTP hydrolase)